MHGREKKHTHSGATTVYQTIYRTTFNRADC